METKRPAEIISAFAGSVLLALYAFEVYNFNEAQLAAVGVVIAGIPSFITAIVETFRSFRQDRQVAHVIDRQLVTTVRKEGLE